MSLQYRQVGVHPTCHFYIYKASADWMGHIVFETGAPPLRLDGIHHSNDSSVRVIRVKSRITV